MKKIIIYITVSLAVVLSAGFLLFRKKKADINIKTTKVVIGSINKIITATGTVEPLMKVEVGTQVSGVIEKIYVDYNAKVKANQLIAELDKTNLKAALAESNATLMTAENELAYQQINFNRIKQLHETKVVSDADYEEALYKLNNAKATVAQRKSDVSRAKTNLSYASIYSPIDGIVISRAVDVGQTVAANFSTPTLFTIAKDLKQMQVEADVDEADIGQVKEGQLVKFTVDAYPGDNFTGTVTQVRLEPVEESNVITYTVIIKADNPEQKLMPGLTASIEIFTLQLANIKTVEAKALNFQPDPEILMAYMKQNDIKMEPGNSVPPGNIKEVPPDTKGVPTPKADDDRKMVWVKAGKDIHPVQVETGASDGVSIQITSGLNEGDEVVYAMSLSSGDSQGAPSGGSPFMPKPPNRNSK